jgi:hypothetical protein
MLAYGAVDQIASAFVNQVCTQLKDSPGKSFNIVLYDATLFASMQASGGFEANQSVLTAQYNAILRELHVALKPEAVGALDIASLILQYSAASVTENAGTVAIPDTAVRLSLLHYFKSTSDSSACKKNRLTVTVVYPLVGMSSSQIQTARAEIATELEDLLELRAKVEKSLADANKKETDEIYKRFTAVNKSYDQFISSLFTPDQTTGAQAMAPVMQGRALFDLLKNDKTYLAYEEFEAGGGTQHIRKNLFTNLFWGDLISYSGGAVIGLALVQASNSSVVLANTLRFRTPFTRIEKPVDTETPKQGDNLSTLSN